MNLADLALAIIFLGIVATGFRRGLVGIALYTLAAIVSLVAAVALTLTAGAAPIPDTWLLLLVPVIFFLTFGLVQAVLHSLAKQVTAHWHKLPIAPADRVLGAVTAGLLGILGLSLAVLVLLEFNPARRVAHVLENGRAAPLLLAAGADEMHYLSGPIPFLRSLATRLAAARDAIPGESSGSRAQEEI